MKKFSIIFLLLLNNYAFSQSYPHITELRGLEDSLTNTHLFYRYISPYSGCWSKNIYHYDLQNVIDTLFIPDFGYQVIPEWGCEGDYVNDYEFFNNNPAKYFYCGYHLWIDPVALLRRYDGDIQIETFALSELEVSKLNESLVYVSAGQGFFKSTDGGYNFEFDDSTQLIDASIISLSHNDDSQIYGINNNQLVRSEDDGLSYLIVDNSYWSQNSELYYDVDGEHIYGLSGAYNYQLQMYISNIYVSDDNGNPFTWNSILEYQGRIWLANDEINTGEIYYSAGNKIFKSSDYGNSFQFYKQLNQNVTGMYKKSGTNILYASTPLKIYEITPDSIQIIKNLPVPESEYAWYPLNPDDKWIYNHTFYGDVGDSIRWISINEVTGYKMLDDKVYNEVTVKEIPIDPGGNSGAHFEYFRIDSTNGKIFKAGIENDSLLYEELYMDLLIQVGDTIPVGNGIYLESEVPFTIFGLESRKRTFSYILTPVQDIRLVKGLGLIYQYLWELVGIKTVLQGCIIDEEVYGDTTVVSIDNEKSPIANEFRLEQNYPNPFNPRTVISYQLPVSSNIALKVFDILGNEVAILVNEYKEAGSYEVEFSGHSDEGQNLPSGVYFYQLRMGGPETSSGQANIQTKKMILLK